jgi:hypothetical protein
VKKSNNRSTLRSNVAVSWNAALCDTCKKLGFGERIISIIRVTIIGERLLVTANLIPSSPILITLMMEAIRFSEYGVTSQKTAFFIVTAVKTSNLTTYTMTFRRVLSSALQ